ncbi:RNA polymerase III Rpc82 C -terminal [Penicillium chermesinum]|nr:RNA polymerase III Rpc82 C -terminal [Penicillium chermesinum]
MMSQHAVELCTLLIEDHFGELFARIFSTLQRYERLSLPRLKFYSHLSDRQLQNGLTAMIQHHLVFHFTSLDDGFTYYEANPHAAYYLVRSGKILHLVADRLGDYAAQIMETVMYLGHASVAHLETMPELQAQIPSHTNGLSHEDENPVSQTEDDGQFAHTNGNHAPALRAPIFSTLKKLASHGYLMRVREAHFQSPSDNYLEAHRIMTSRADIKNMKGKKYIEAVQDGVKNLIEERTGADLSESLQVNGLPRGVKRKRQGAVTTNGINGNYVEGDREKKHDDWSDDENELDETPMDSDLVVTVNYDKLDVALRNAKLVQFAAESNAPTATTEVFKCLLRRIEYATPRCREFREIPAEGEENDHFSVPIELQDLVDLIDPDLDLSSTFAPTNPPTSQPNSLGKRPLANGVNGDHYEDSTDASNSVSRAFEVNQHLNLLSEPPYNFTSSFSQAVIKWRVEFRGLARKLRHLELERMIETRYGDVALRVIRVLHTKGKLDEKRLLEISMLPFKELRQTLASMQSGGFVDLQEVPKDSQRQPSKTIFLWYYDPDRVCSNLLEDTYKAMSRTLQRIRFERDRLKDFLDKTERSDVKGHEEEYLTEEELEILQQWRDKEALLLAEVSRLDEMVAVFRDY